jgi:hypothetical protein
LESFYFTFIELLSAFFGGNLDISLQDLLK